MASGEIDRNGAISKSGDRLAQEALFVAAHSLLTRVIRWSTLGARDPERARERHQTFRRGGRRLSVRAAGTDTRARAARLGEGHRQPTCGPRAARRAAQRCNESPERAVQQIEIVNYAKRRQCPRRCALRSAIAAGPSTTQEAAKSLIFTQKGGFVPTELIPIWLFERQRGYRKS